MAVPARSQCRDEIHDCADARHTAKLAVNDGPDLDREHPFRPYEANQFGVLICGQTRQDGRTDAGAACCVVQAG
jgi:hypothetical protein